MNPVVNYFSEERAESILFMLVGVIASAIALYLYFGLRTSFVKGVAIPVALVTILELAGGAFIFLRSPKDITRVESYRKDQPQKIRTIEIPRMKTVMRNFIIYRNVEIALIALSLFLMFTASTGSFWKGVGMGLLIQATLVLCLDYFAERRAQIYMDYLLKIENK